VEVPCPPSQLRWYSRSSSSRPHFEVRWPRLLATDLRCSVELVDRMYLTCSGPDRGLGTRWWYGRGTEMEGTAADRRTGMVDSVPDQAGRLYRQALPSPCERMQEQAEGVTRAKSRSDDLDGWKRRGEVNPCRKCQLPFPIKGRLSD
jgi:hypothetical protein